MKYPILANYKKNKKSMEVFSAAPNHEVLMLVIQVAILLLTARVFGELAQRFNQPSVVCELLAGIILFTFLLIGLFTALFQWLLSQTKILDFLMVFISIILEF